MLKVSSKLLLALWFAVLMLLVPACDKDCSEAKDCHKCCCGGLSASSGCSSRQVLESDGMKCYCGSGYQSNFGADGS